MTDAVATAPDLATVLAEWTTLTDARFGLCYAKVCQAGARSWEVIVASSAGALKLEACREAARAGFLGELAEAVGDREAQAGRSFEEKVTMLNQVRGYGLLQAMTNQQKGLMSGEIFKPLERVRDASAVVFNRNSLDRLGTAFLVRPDLVMTAAHVVLEPDATGLTWSTQLKGGLAFRFKARDGQPKLNFVEILPTSDQPLVCSGAPHGIPPNRLDRSMTPIAGERLDYALVRLAQRVDHVDAVEIVDGAGVEQGKVCWAFGFPGGDALMLDVDVVTDIHAPAGRWLHQANAAPGMSGGCCVNHEGRVVGLHEGALDIPQGTNVTWRNRGVSMTAIRKAQCGNGKDPLKEPTTTPGLELQDATAVAELYLAGSGLAGPDRIALWRDLMIQAIGADPETQRMLPSFHPWFVQREVEAWIDSADPELRLSLVYGDRGVGKSFCARILREKLGARVADLFAFTPTQLGAMNWPDAIGPIVVPEVSDHRTDAASIRYRDFQQVIDEVQRRSGEAGRSSHVVMDFGPSADSRRFDGTQWMELIAALLAAEGVRVMVIGLDEFERNTLLDRLHARPETEPVAQNMTPLEIRHPRQHEFRSYIKALAKARGKPVPPELDAIVQNIFGPGVQLGSLLTVMAALAAIKFERASSLLAPTVPAAVNVEASTQ